MVSKSLVLSALAGVLAATAGAETLKEYRAGGIIFSAPEDWRFANEFEEDFMDAALDAYSEGTKSSDDERVQDVQKYIERSELIAQLFPPDVDPVNGPLEPYPSFTIMTMPSPQRLSQRDMRLASQAEKDVLLAQLQDMRPEIERLMNRPFELMNLNFEIQDISLSADYGKQCILIVWQLSMPDEYGGIYTEDIMNYRCPDGRRFVSIEFPELGQLTYSEGETLRAMMNALKLRTAE